MFVAVAAPVGNDAIDGVTNDGMEAAKAGNTDCWAAANDGRLRRASRFRERAVVDAMAAEIDVEMCGWIELE